MQHAVNLEQAIVENLRQLPLEKQQELLDFAEFLRQKSAVKQSSRSVKGLWAELEIDMSAEEMTEARQAISTCP